MFAGSLVRNDPFKTVISWLRDEDVEESNGCSDRKTKEKENQTKSFKP